MNEETVAIALARAIRARRLALGFSQDSFADRIAMHRSYYAALERGQRNMTLSTLGRLAQGLGCPISVLFIEADL
ncbi:helix-turn-helix domain-containing protein [Stenotrophomonas rhizophila]|uniref:helix-turn-helix domain-containing protein n=1 Tax=Stenotrophomonas rhizophila TaxID=216778 RepID=UPI00112F33AC|nr:helix-turn-helix transcriptional regulator [Stenotrophomonas rhizophila]